MNVLFITADQWRGDCLSAHDHPCLETPHLDALAADGVLFERHYSQASPCTPGRASLYTGMYLHKHRCVVNGTPLDARHSNVALEARKAGYDPVLRGERYKYVHFTAMPALFFDLEEDPGELHDLADDSDHRTLVLEHAQKMLSWRMNHDERVLANTRLTNEGVVERKPPRY
jgi:arylsulfatase A-like enzyme